MTARNVPLLTLALLLLCVSWVPLSSALVVHKTISLHSMVDFEQFGFAEHGTISLAVDIVPPQNNVTVFICTDKQFDVLSSFTAPEEVGFCSSVAHCEYSGDYRIEVVKHLVQSKNRYHLVLVQCATKETLKAYVKYTLLNPGGEQLPLGEIPLPTLYILVTIIWAVLVVLCGVVWVRNRQHVVMLHSLLASVGVLKLAVVIVALCYWRNFQVTGEEIVQLKYLQSFIYALSETAFFCALLLISKGWRITRSNLPPSEIRTISVALILLLSTLLFFSFYNDGYYFLSLMIMYFFMLPKIFTSITRNTRALHTHMLLARYANLELNTVPILAKIQMFKTLRTAVILYLGSILVISSMKIIMWWFLVWVTYCVSEVVTIVMVVAVCVLTRPRENGVFSPRSYFEGGTFPILNMQQFDHFDELFGDQIWDPDLVFGNALAAQQAQPQIDMSEAIVIEYPLPAVDEKDEGTRYYPRLAIAMLEKKEKDGANVSDGGSSSGNDGEKRSLFRRRGTSSNSSSASTPSFVSSLASSTTALLAPSPLMSSASSTPLLLHSSPSMQDGLSSFAPLDLDISGIALTTFAEPPALNLNSPPTTTTTTTSTIDTQDDFRDSFRHKRRTRTNSSNHPTNTTTTTTTTTTTRKMSNSNSDDFIRNSETTTSTTTTTCNTNTPEKSSKPPFAELGLTPQFKSTSSLLSGEDKDEDQD